MSSKIKSRFNSPFIYTTFEASDRNSIFEVYKQRIIDVYSEQYPSIKQLSIDSIDALINQYKLDIFKQQQNEKQKKEKEEESDADKLENDANMRGVGEHCIKTKIYLQDIQNKGNFALILNL